jgi:hypothetical protein
VQASSTLTGWTTVATKAGAAAWMTTPGTLVNDPGAGSVTVTGEGPFMRLRVTRP